MLWGGFLKRLLLRFARMRITCVLFVVLFCGAVLFQHHFFCGIIFYCSSSLSPYGCSGLYFGRSLWIARTTTWFCIALDIGEGLMMIIMGLLVGGLVGARHDLRLFSGTTDAWYPRLGLRRLSRILSVLLFWRGKFWNDHRIGRIGILCLQLQVVLFPRLRVGFLVLYTYFLMQLPVRSRRIVVITVKVPAGSARYGRQCRSSKLSLPLVLFRLRLTVHMVSQG